MADGLTGNDRFLQGVDAIEMIYCTLMETEVPIEGGECKKILGSILKYTDCPNKRSLVCPLEKLKEETL